MKKILNNLIILLLSLIFIFVIFSIAYSRLAPESALTVKLRSIPVLKHLLAEPTVTRVQGEQSSITTTRRIVKYVITPRPRPYRTTILLEGTNLYSEPHNENKTDEVVEQTKRYKVLSEREGGWACIEMPQGKRWIGPDRFNMLNYEPSPLEKSALNMDRDIIDYPMDIWYPSLVEKKIKSILETNKNLQKYTGKYFTIYFKNEFKPSIEVLESVISELRAEYDSVLGSQIELKEEVFTPVFFLVTGDSITTQIKDAFKSSLIGNYTFGIILIDIGKVEPEQMLNAFLHEYVHHINRVVLRMNGFHISPQWINEGLAEYFANIKYPAVIKFEEQRKGGRSGSTPLDSKIILANYLYKTKRYFSYHDLIQDEIWKKIQSRPYIVDTRSLYTTTWTLVAYFMDAEKGRFRRYFIRYLVDTIEGGGNLDELLKTCGFSNFEELGNGVGDAIINNDLLELYKKPLSISNR